MNEGDGIDRESFETLAQAGASMRWLEKEAARASRLSNQIHALNEMDTTRYSDEELKAHQQKIDELLAQLESVGTKKPGASHGATTAASAAYLAYRGCAMVITLGIIALVVGWLLS